MVTGVVGYIENLATLLDIIGNPELMDKLTTKSADKFSRDLAVFLIQLLDGTMLELLQQKPEIADKIRKFIIDYNSSKK